MLECLVNLLPGGVWKHSSLSLNWSVRINITITREKIESVYKHLEASRS